MSKLSRRKFTRQSLCAAAGLSASAAFSAFSVGRPDERNMAAVLPGFVPGAEANRKICVFSKHLQWLNYTDMAAAAADIGFDGVDLTVRPNGHVLPERVADDLPKAAEAVEKAGLKVYMLTTEITDPDHPHTAAILQTASRLGIGYYRTGWLKYQDKLSVTQNIEAFKTKLNGIAALNKKYTIHGDYQNHSGTGLGGSVWDLWLVIKDIDPTWLGCQYDIRHATVEGAYSWPQGLKLIQPHIRTLDIKDFHWARKEGKWQVENVPLGNGMVDFKQYFSLLRQYNINGPISLHFEYPLGGAEHGATQITIPKEEILKTMKKDLTLLKTWLKEAGLT